MNNNQNKYLEYAKDFSHKNKVHIWLGGSFLKGNATSFSDVDLSVLCDNDLLGKFIYRYGKPVYLSYTSNPKGILIVIYEDGVAVDLEVIKSIQIPDNELFHAEDIKKCDYVRDENICEVFALQKDTPYQMSRLFHRSLIKYLGGKREAGISVANEIASYMNCGILFDERNYKEQIEKILKEYNKLYQFPKEYFALLLELTDKL